MWARRAIVLMSAIAIMTVVLALPTLEPVSGCVRSEVWPASLIALHTLSDSAIALAYTWIPVTLLAVWRARKDIPMNWTLLCFAAFIVLCGLTHVMGTLTVWEPVYWLSGEVKAATAVVSLATASLLTLRVYPLLLAIPTADVLRIAKERAEEESRAAKEASLRAEEMQRQLEDANTRLLAANEQLEARAGDLAVSNETLGREAKDLQEALEKVRQQEIAIRELSMPLLEIYPGVLLVPIVGKVDPQRASQLLEVVSEGVSARRASAVILDLTGVPVVDAAVANSLIQAAGILELLGARCIATGIRPAVARTIVELGVAIDTSIATRGSLSQGLLLAIGRDRRGAIAGGGLP